MTSTENEFSNPVFEQRNGTDSAQQAISPLRPTDILITSKLASRPSRGSNLAAETVALREIAALISVDPRHAARRALDWAVTLCDAGSAGLSLLEASPAGDPWFRWDEMSGLLEPHTSGGAPRHFSPCGLCLDAGTTILVERPSRVFEYMNAATQPVVEGLIVPLYGTGGDPLGTVWLVHHETGRAFDSEDARVLEELAAVLVLALRARRRAAEPVRDPESRGVALFRIGGRTDRSTNPFVRKLAGFAALSRDDESVLRSVSAETFAVAARTDLIREGDPTGGVFLMMEGIACRYRVLSGGRRQITAYMLPGDLCDLDIALLSRMDHAIMTLTPARVIRIPRATVVDLTRNHSTIATALRKSTLVDEATLREWLVNIGSRPALERIAHLFCELQVRLQVVGLATADRYELPITQTDLADTTGLSSVHVNRTLQELRRRGLITLAGKALTILDPFELRRLADFRANYLHIEGRVEEA